MNLTLRVELFVENVAQSVEFYKTILGFAELSGSEEYHPLYRGAVTIGIGPVSRITQNYYFQPDIISGRKGVGLEIVLELDDIQAEYNRVKDSGYPINQALKKQV